MPEDWDDDNTNDNSNGPKALRDHLRKIEDELKAERETRSKLEVQVRQGAIKDVLTSQGFSPKIAAIVPPTVEANEESLKAWLNEHADIFPKAVSAEGAGAVAVGGDNHAPVTTAAAPDRMGAALAAGLPPDQVNSLENQVDQAQTPEDLEKVLSQLKHLRFKS